MKFKTARILFLGDVFATAVTQLLKHPFIKWMQYELHSGTFYKCKITRITQTWLQIGHWRHTGWRAGRISLQRYKTSWKGMLRVLPPTSKLSWNTEIKLLQAALVTLPWFWILFSAHVFWKRQSPISSSSSDSWIESVVGCFQTS